MRPLTGMLCSPFNRSAVPSRGMRPANHPPCRRQAKTTLLTLVICVAGLTIVTRATPGFWQAATQADFLRGEVEQLSIDVHGRLTLGPQVDRIYDAGVPFIWTAVPAPGGGFFLGTGNEGRVLRVSRDGKGTTFFDSGEMEVHALAAGPDGGLYVGTSPDGRIYKVDAKGNGTPFFDPEDKYIWALAVNREGVLFAATGDKGVVYRITPDGQGKPFFSAKTTHAVSLAFDARGELLVGTGSPGRVFRVDPAGKGFLLLDTPYQEIHTLRVAPRGTIYVAAQTGRPPSGDDRSETPTLEPSRGMPVPSVSTEITSIAIVDMPVTPQQPAQQPAREDRSGPTGAIYRINADGLWDVLWESREDAPYDLMVEPDDALLVATGAKGKIFRLSGEPVQATLVTRVLAQQITMLLPSPDRTWVLTANPGLVLGLSNGRADRGVYDSDVKDARMVATWGTLSWRASAPAGTRVELYTRAGNTRTPDEAWSEWSSPYGNAEGSPITSPKARYLQWRAVLTGKGQTPVLTSVAAAYLQRNVRPQVGSITVHPPGTVFQKPFSTGEAEIAGYDDGNGAERPAQASGGASSASGSAPSLGRRVHQKGLQTFVWKAEDDNGDELTFDVLYRREGETSWKLLKGGLTEPITVWDTTSAPDGSYVMKVVAADRQSNPADTALKGELESTSFDIDNTPPTVVMNGVRRDGKPVVTFDVRDGHSAIARVEYSLDAQRWQATFPRDGILDGRDERFEITLDASASGRTLVVRATDELGNVGTGQTAVP
jgi:sugar lactone lactonase YvrE